MFSIKRVTTILTFINNGMLLFSFVDKSVNQLLIHWSYSSFTLHYQNCIIIYFLVKSKIHYLFVNK